PRSSVREPRSSARDARSSMREAGALAVECAAIHERPATGDEGIVVEHHGAVPPVASPVAPPPAEPGEEADPEADAEDDPGVRDEESGIRVPPRPCDDGRAVD